MDSRIDIRDGGDRRSANTGADGGAGRDRSCNRLEADLFSGNGLEDELAGRIASAARELLAPVDLDFFRLLGNVDGRLALRARPRLAGELVLDLKTLLAARTDDEDRHAMTRRRGKSSLRSLVSHIRPGCQETA